MHAQQEFTQKLSVTKLEIVSCPLRASMAWIRMISWEIGFCIVLEAPIHRAAEHRRSV